jgi:steroid delta-isomerase
VTAAHGTLRLMSEVEARAHIDRFNEAVTSGDWSAFLATLAPDAVMTFVGPPIGPFTGRAAIAAAYAADPPDDTMHVVEVDTTGPADVILFEWTRGGTGTLTLQRAAGLITHLTVVFH